jgi:RNase P/RNase MRP subunit POP5
MKPLKPSHREKKRYLLISGAVSKEAIETAIFDFIGVLGYAEASPHFISFGKNKIILAINRKSLEKIRASFLLSDKEIRIERVSGSLKKLKH